MKAIMKKKFMSAYKCCKIVTKYGI